MQSSQSLKAGARHWQILSGALFLLLGPIGCGPTSLLSDQDPTPPSVAVDGNGDTYELVGDELDEDPAVWNFAIRGARTAESPFTFRWDFADGKSYEGLTQSYTYESDGDYTVLVDALDDSAARAFTLGLKVKVNRRRDTPPVADAGADQSVEEAEPVTLYGGQSWDAEQSLLSFQWTQLSGPGVDLQGAQTMTPSFDAPEVEADTQLVFSVRVGDGRSYTEDTCGVVVKNVTTASPIAIAGADQIVVEGASVTLDGRASTGGVTEYAWKQVAGPLLELADSASATPAFAAPGIAAGKSLELLFELNAAAGETSTTDQVRVVVNSDGRIEPDARCNDDTDRDRIVDCSDQCADDPAKAVPGVCGCGKIELDGDSDGTPDCADECPVDPAKSAPGVCGCGISEDDPSCGACLTTTSSWQNATLPAQYNLFEFHFAATPSSTGIDAIIGVSEGPGAGFADYAVLVRFDASGVIDVRNGGSYMSSASMTYAAGMTYLFRIVIDVAAGAASVFVAPEGGAEVAVAEGYAFRTEQAGTTKLDNWAAWSQNDGQLEVCDASVAGLPLTVDAGAAKTISPGASTVLDGRAIGGVPPYRYAWSPATGLSSAAVAQPTASPTSTTMYSLTVSDSLNATATDTVAVSVQTLALAANAGPDKSISSGASVVLAGAASGGVPPYTYQWSPATGLSSATVAQPTASPSASTTYTLTVEDSTNASASDSAVVTVGTSGTGRTFFVANAGNDSNPGTETQPWRTLAKGSSTAQPGDTVYVKAGTYNESIRASRSGTAGNLITFKAAPGDECTHTGSYWNNPVCDVVLSGGNIDINRQSYIRVEGFAVTGYNGPGVWCQDRGSEVVNHVELVNNYIHDLSGYGIECRNPHDTLIEGNYIRDIHGSAAIGIRGDRTPKNLTIRGNTILHVDCDGVHVEGQGVVIENNTLGDSYHTDCHQDALEVYGPVDGLIIRNNLIWDWTQNIYLSAETNYIRNTAVLGNVVWCDRYCAQGSDAPGVNCGPNVADVTNLRVEGNTFHNVWNLFTDSYARSSSYWITGLVIRNNLFANSRYSVEINGSFSSDYNLFHQTRIRGHNTLAGYRAAGGSGETNSLEVDPKLVNPIAFDFRIRTDSPAVDRGTMIEDLRSDPDGKTRYLGAGFDIGAYEAR